MAYAVLALVLVGCAAVGACSRDEGLRCEDTSTYSSSTSIPPIRVPDDLTVPDESESLLIPEVADSAEEPPTESCLEEPPDYFEGDAEG